MRQKESISRCTSKCWRDCDSGHSVKNEMKTNRRGAEDAEVLHKGGGKECFGFSPSGAEASGLEAASPSGPEALKGRRLRWRSYSEL